MSLLRSNGDMRDHGPLSNARRAAATAASISAASPSAALAIGRPVDGSNTSKVLPDLAFTHASPINNCKGLAMNRAARSGTATGCSMTFIGFLLSATQFLLGHSAEGRLALPPAIRTLQCGGSGGRDLARCCWLNRKNSLKLQMN